MRSIRRTLLTWLSAGMAICIFATAYFTYGEAIHYANELFDYQMKQIAASLPRQASLPMESGRGEAIDLDEDILIQIWDKTGVRIYQSHERPNLPPGVSLGFSDVKTGDGVWRVFAAFYGNTVVQVAQPARARAAQAASTALKVTAPLLLLLLLMAILIWLAIGRALAPVLRTAEEVRKRDTHALTPLSDVGLPVEIQPLTGALNELLARLARAVETQREFVADAAHELRTPLAALSLQLQLLERATNEGDRAAAVADLRKGLERASGLVGQLLILSRQDSDAAEKPSQNVNLLELARVVVSDQASIAANKNIDLGVIDHVEASFPPLMDGDSEGLRVMLNCLVDNAVRHTPADGRVDVEVVTDIDRVRVTVTDTGPGIPEDERARVFDRFYRRDDGGSEGSGLGLAIVKRVVARHRGEIRLTEGNDGRGLSALIEFSRSN